MNKNNLQVIFKKYIDNFELINSKKHNEIYKWEIAQQFQDFDVEAEDFAEMLNRICKASDNLIDSSQRPFSALVEYSRKEKEAETVREMFRNLFAQENLDCDTKQQTINEFIKASEELRMKYYPDSWRYVNDQRSVMMYLFLRYPDSNFGYKANQAKRFADCIEFYDDWGPMTDFKLDIFCRMCEQVIEEIKANEALMATHKSRYENTARILHPDTNLHILVADIIYCSQTYDFYGDMTFTPINAQARKLHFERVAKAKDLEDAVEKAEHAADLLIEAQKYIATVLTKGATVNHRKFGDGVIKDCTGGIVSVFFPEANETKRLGLAFAFGNGLLTLSDEEVTQKVKEYAPILNREQDIPKKLARAIEELQPYLEYLD